MLVTVNICFLYLQKFIAWKVCSFPSHILDLQNIFCAYFTVFNPADPHRRIYLVYLQGFGDFLTISPSSSSENSTPRRLSTNFISEVDTKPFPSFKRLSFSPIFPSWTKWWKWPCQKLWMPALSPLVSPSQPLSEKHRCLELFLNWENINIGFHGSGQLRYALP